jgi:hypothetical protein
MQKTCKSMQKYEKICKSMSSSSFVKTHESVAKHEKVFQNLREFVKLEEGVSKPKIV